MVKIWRLNRPSKKISQKKLSLSYLRIIFINSNKTEILVLKPLWKMTAAKLKRNALYKYYICIYTDSK